MSALGLGTLMVGMAGCGQRGPLYLPTDPAAKGRATLPQVLVPGTRNAGEPAGDGSNAIPPAPGTSSGVYENGDSGNEGSVTAPATRSGAGSGASQ